MGIINILEKITNRNQPSVVRGATYKNKLTAALQELLLPAYADRTIWLREVGDANCNLELVLEGSNTVIGSVVRNRQNGTAEHINVYTGLAAEVHCFSQDIDLTDIRTTFENQVLDGIPNPFVK